jgi:hypothetical protein
MASIHIVLVMRKGVGNGIELDTSDHSGIARSDSNPLSGKRRQTYQSVWPCSDGGHQSPQNRGRGVPGAVNSPVFGEIGKVGGPLGKILIHELDPITGARTGYDIEILHTESRFVREGAKVIPRQPIGMQGGVGVNGVDKNGNGIPGASHAHIQVYRGSDPTPLNPLRHLYEYHHPGQPFPQLPEFFPESIPPRPDRPARPDPLLSDDPVPPNAPPGGRRPAAPITRPSTSPPDRLTPPRPAPRPPSSAGQPLDITPPVQRIPLPPDGGFEPGSTGATGQLYFSPQSSPQAVRSIHAARC